MRWKLVLGILAGAFMLVLIAVIIVASTYDFNRFKPRITELAKEYTGRELKINGNIKLGISLHPSLAMDDIAFQNASWGSRPEMVTVKRIEVRIALLPLIKGTINVENLNLFEPDYLIEIDRHGRTNMAFDVPEKPRTNARENETEAKIASYFGLRDITIKNGKLTFVDHRNNSKDVLILQEYVQKAAGFRAESKMKLSGAYNNDPIKLQGKVGSLANIFDPSERWDLDLTAEGFESKIAVTGSLMDVIGLKGIDLKISAEGQDLARLEKVSRRRLPVKGPFSVSGHLVASNGDKIDVSEISILLGESKLSGEFAIDQSAKKTNIIAKLISETLDLRPIIAREKELQSDTQKHTLASQAKPDRLFPDTPLQLRGWNEVNADIAFKAKQILLPHLALDNFISRIVLKDGHLSVNPLSSGIGGGQLESSLDLLTQASRASASVKMSVKELNFGEMLKKLAITDDLEGTLELNVSLNGEGGSVAALMGGLNGDVVAILREGVMPVQYLDLLGADFGSSLMRLVNPFSEEIDQATINCAVSDFYIEDGMATTDVLMLDDAQKTLISDGKIDLKTEKLDFVIETKPKEGIGTQQTGKVSISLNDITKPFKLGGTLAHPSLQIDVAGSVMTIGAALLGPAGWSYLLVSGSSGEKTPCELAMEAAGKGPSEKNRKPEKEKGHQVAGEKKDRGEE
jgi:uncharacterized protein involved in outer membrane biogenesis